jgi:hypothetical protein
MMPTLEDDDDVGIGDEYSVLLNPTFEHFSGTFHRKKYMNNDQPRIHFSVLKTGPSETNSKCL